MAHASSRSQLEGKRNSTAEAEKVGVGTRYCPSTSNTSPDTAQQRPEWTTLCTSVSIPDPVYQRLELCSADIEGQTLLCPKLLSAADIIAYPEIPYVGIGHRIAEA
eukprot:220180-Rhodomonas_salina.2